LDNILPSEDRSRLFLVVGLLALLLLARAGIQYLRSLLLIRQSFDFNLRIIDFFYGRLLKLPKSFFDNRKTGDLIARMNDTQRI
jgi:ABC-type bacteriocin/lantibiotic exporter with double-glycine peptidase domain